MPELAAAPGEKHVEAPGLSRGAGIAIEDDAGLGREAVERLADDARDDLVGHQFARFHHGLGLEADRRAGLDGGAQHVAGRELDHAALGHEALGLRALAGAGRTKQDDVHALTPSDERPRRPCRGACHLLP